MKTVTAILALLLLVVSIKYAGEIGKRQFYEKAYWVNYDRVILEGEEMDFVRSAISRGIDPFKPPVNIVEWKYADQDLDYGVTLPPECANRWCTVRMVIKNNLLDYFNVSYQR